MTLLRGLETAGVGILIGFLGGLFGKGGSAVATPLLRLLGWPAFVSVASPLPATTPGTLVAAAAYWKNDLLDWPVVGWSIVIGIPSTVAGAWMSKWTGGDFLLILTALMVLGFGLSFLLRPEGSPHRHEAAPVIGPTGLAATPEVAAGEAPALAGADERSQLGWRLRLGLVASSVGLVSGLLANSGGFLLAPLYARVLKLPLKTAFGTSLLVAAVLSVPGTLVHWYLGHISWPVAGLVAAGSVPLSFLGAQLAIRTSATRLERLYGIALTVLGIFFLFHH